AARAGLKAHDHLIAIDGKQLEDYSDLVERMKSVKESTRLRVQVERDLAVTLGSVPAASALQPQPRALPPVQVQPPAQVQPDGRWQMIPPGTYTQPSEDLQRELRALSDQL